MSTTETILSRMMSDADFANALLADADKALAEYNLSADEIAKFKDLTRTELEQYSNGSPEERKSFGWTNHNESTLG